MSWSGFSNSEKLELGKLYVPYLALCKCRPRKRIERPSSEKQADVVAVAIFMGVDMYGRLIAAVGQGKKATQKKSQ